MSALSDVRAAMRDVLKDAGMFAFSTVPDKALPPMVFVAPGDPYVSTEGANFGGEIVRCEVVVVASAGVNEAQADELDELALQAKDVLEAADYNVVDIGRPGQITLGGQAYLAAPLGVLTEINRDRE